MKNDIAKLVWLASYPKSGNTWFRIFLSNYLKNADTHVNINELKDGAIASSRNLFDEICGIPSSDLTHEEIDLYRPAIYCKLAEKAKDLSFHKIHDAFVRNKDGKPIIPKVCTKAVIYIIRNPLDISVSFAHHSSVSVTKAISRMNDNKFAFCKRNDRLASQLRQKLKNWSEHVKSWLESDLPMIVLRYEDMLSDTENQFSRALRFLDIEVEETRLEKAIKFSSINELKQQEEKLGFKERMQNSTSFFRKGVKDDWKNYLTRNQIEEIISYHSDLMYKFGYFVKKM